MTVRSRLNLLLAVVLVALLVMLSLFLVKGARAVPGQTDAERKAAEIAAVQKAARQRVLDFLAIDHAHMDKITAKVLAGSTGTFKKQYAASVDTLTKQATSQASLSTGSVLQVGVSDIDLDSATVAVAANSRVKNKGTAQKWETRTWRIQLRMQKVHGQWLTSDLQFVG